MKRVIFLLLLLISGETIAGVRIVSLSPALTDAIVAIGGKNLLCGKSRVCNAPGTENIPIAGNMGLPAAEKILSLRPDYVVSDTRHPGGNWKTLERQGIKLIFLPGKNIADHPANLRKLGKLFDLESSAEKAAQDFEAKISELRRTVPGNRIRVLAVLAVSPVISCGSESFLNEALTLAGAENICGSVKRSYFTVSPEYILKSAPEAIIFAGIPEKTAKQYFSRPEFRTLPAVKQQNFISVDPDKFCRAGNQLPEAIGNLKLQLSRNAVSPGAASHSLR